MADERISGLRAWMKTNGVDAYLVPHADRFQSEYLPPEDERLAWLTGFTGSAGMALILVDKAALFTDGRYTLQAAQQIDTDIYEVVESPPTRPAEWLRNHLPENGVIGFDPWLFTVAQMNMWQGVARQYHWQLKAINDNPVDALWHDRPAPQIALAHAHPLEFSGVATTEKIAQILAQKNAKAGHVLISDPGLVCWLLNMRGHDVAHVPLVQSVTALDSEGQVILFTDPRKITDDLRKTWGNHVAVNDLGQLTEFLATLSVVQIDPSQCAYAVKDFCIENGVEIVEATDPSLLLRASKNETEINGAILAHEKDAKAFAAFLEWFNARDFVNEHITEQDVIDKLYVCRKADADCVDTSFDTIAGFGANGAIVHYRCAPETNLRLVPDSLLLLDSGGQYRMGTTDITRVLPVGTPSAQMKQHYTAVLKGLIALSTARFPVGTTGMQLDALARAPIWALGLDYAHGTGHGVGSYLSVHEGPTGISSRHATPLQAGMVISIEPGIYLAGQYGIRLENLVVVIDDTQPGDIKPMLAFKTLTKVPFDMQLVDENALTAKERAFLQH